MTLGILWRGRIWLTIPMLFAIAFLWNFVIGGLTGIYLSDVPADIQLHGGMFVTAHFHYTIVGGALLGFFAAVYYWFPKMTGRMMDENLGRIHFWGTQIGFNVAFLAMFVAGLQGMPRRVADYAPQFATANLITSIFAFLLAASIVVFFYNVVASWVAGEKAVANPWGAKTLEWLVPTPVPLENFEQIPVVTGIPHDYGEPVPQPGCRWPGGRVTTCEPLLDGRSAAQERSSRALAHERLTYKGSTDRWTPRSRKPTRPPPTTLTMTPRCAWGCGTMSSPISSLSGFSSSPTSGCAPTTRSTRDSPWAPSCPMRPCKTCSLG